jgi:hypothetical protein
MTLAPAADETQESRQADPPLLDRRDGAEALVTGRARSDLLRRSDGRLVAAGDGPPMRGYEGWPSRGPRRVAGRFVDGD